MNNPSEIAFSHRPYDGISVGIAVKDGCAYTAVSFVRKGVDQFSRKLAQRIVTNRIEKAMLAIDSVPNVSVTAIPHGIDARHIMREFRKMFKPDPKCGDYIFWTVDNMYTPIRPMLREEAWKEIIDITSEAITQATKKQCVS